MPPSPPSRPRGRGRVVARPAPPRPYAVPMPPSAPATDALRDALARDTRRGIGLLGAHFLPYGGLYRSPSCYAPGIGSVLLAAGVQWAWPRHANHAIPLAMLACCALAAAGVWRENRHADRSATPC